MLLVAHAPTSEPDPIAVYRDGAPSRATWVAAGLGLGTLAAVLPAWLLGGDAVGAAVVLAAGICLSCSLLSIVLSCLSATPEQVLLHVVSGMFLRMALALASCGLIYTQGGWPVQGGLVYFLIPFYLLALTLETVQDVIALQAIFPPPRRATVSR
jgi:hypothetical protein